LDKALKQLIAARRMQAKQKSGLLRLGALPEQLSWDGLFRHLEYLCVNLG